MLMMQPVFAIEAGAPAPTCVLPVLKGGDVVGLESFKGKVVYLDFWASWCGPCAKSFPFMNELHQQLSGKGLQMVGVNLDENPDDAQAFLEKYPANFIVTADKDEGCARSYDVKAMPSSYLIGRDGTLRHIHMGFRGEEGKELREQVEKLLAEKAPAADGKP